MAWDSVKHRDNSAFTYPSICPKPLRSRKKPQKATLAVINILELQQEAQTGPLISPSSLGAK